MKLTDRDMAMIGQRCKWLENEMGTLGNEKRFSFESTVKLDKLIEDIAKSAQHGIGTPQWRETFITKDMATVFPNGSQLYDRIRHLCRVAEQFKRDHRNDSTAEASAELERTARISTGPFSPRRVTAHWISRKSGKQAAASGGIGSGPGPQSPAAVGPSVRHSPWSGPPTGALHTEPRAVSDARNFIRSLDRSFASQRPTASQSQAQAERPPAPLTPPGLPITSYSSLDGASGHPSLERLQRPLTLAEQVRNRLQEPGASISDPLPTSSVTPQTTGPSVPPSGVSQSQPGAIPDPGDQNADLRPAERQLAAYRQSGSGATQSPERSQGQGSSRSV
jgi:hypothetical protein